MSEAEGGCTRCSSRAEPSDHRSVRTIPVRSLHVAVVLMTLLAGATAHALTVEHVQRRSPFQVMAAAPNYRGMYRSHRIGNIGFSLTNWGQFGSLRRFDCCDFCTGRPAESFELPIGSGNDYLAVGSLWIGAVRDRDTLVSIGNDGWGATNEYFPRPWPDGAIIERTNRPALRAAPGSRCPDVYFSEDAISEQDLITYYYDTVTNAQLVPPDPWDGRPHIPVGVEVYQRSYAWSFDYAKDFVLVDLALRNLSGDLLQRLYMGVFMDQDVGHFSNSGELNWDDITGFIHTVPSSVAPGYLDTLNIAWTADNDGDPSGSRYGITSPTGVAGVRVIRAPTKELKFSFNWWVSNSSASRDWGPNRRNHSVEYTRGNLGTPLGDKVRYQMLSNGEFDYDQIQSAIDHQADGWLPPLDNPTLMSDIADGYDTRYLLSFGPFDLEPDSVLSLTIAFVAGSDFHTDATDFVRFFDPGKPEAYLGRLDFTALARNAQWAGWVYDTPGYDTDGDGNRGQYIILDRDTLYFSGDGVPDFQGPPPPPAPELRFTTLEGKIVMRWNGHRSETMKDFFSHVADFEGYRVYMSRTGQLEDFALLSQRDNVNYIRYIYRRSTDRWLVRDRPFSLDSLRALYNDLVDTVYGFTPFHPDSFKVRDPDLALREIVVDAVDPSRLDTNYYCFEGYDANETADDAQLAHLADSLGHEVTGVIRKRFPHAAPADTMWEEGVPYATYYEYEYVIDGLQLAEPVYLAITAFDFGDPPAGLPRLESSPLANMEQIWPINAAAVVKSDRPKPGVYPNPYRLADDYNAEGWEDPVRLGLDPERARRVTFTNVPDTCTVSIWSLDGDLVRRLDHASDPVSSEASVVVWDLITRNTQAVKTGVYIYTIESRFGTDVGKLVIIK